MLSCRRERGKKTPSSQHIDRRRLAVWWSCRLGGAEFLYLYRPELLALEACCCSMLVISFTSTRRFLARPAAVLSLATC